MGDIRLSQYELHNVCHQLNYLKLLGEKSYSYNVMLSEVGH